MSASGDFGETLCGAAHRFNIAVIKIAEFGTGLEEDSIALPVKAVGQDDFANCANGNSFEFHDGANAIADPKLDLIGVGYG